MRIFVGLAFAGFTSFLVVGSAFFHGRSPDENVISIEGLPASHSGQYAAIVLFQSEDCASYENFLDALGFLHRSGRVPVLGVPINASRGQVEVRQAKTGFDPDFPLNRELADQAVALISQMGYRRTPLAVLLDPRGRPLLVIPPHPVPYRQAEITRIVTEYVENLNSGGAIQ